MTSGTLILRSLTHHLRSHVGVVLGATVGATVLIGALLVGDSIRATLREMALARIGKVDQAMVTGDRLFREQLAADLAATGFQTAPVLLLPGTANSGDNAARANRVQVVGVSEPFWDFGHEQPGFASIPEDAVVLNTTLAAQLGVKPGDEIVLRVPKLSSLSRDAPMAPQEDTSSGLRLTVKSIVTGRQFGRFSLQANQVPPFNAFVSLKLLQKRVNAEGRANVLLSSVKPDGAPPSLTGHWRLEDLDLKLRINVTNGLVELRSPRVFLDPPVVRAVTNAFPNARLIQTYFVNELRVGDRAAPYSMVTAVGAPLVPPEMRDDEVIINEALNEDLQAKAGDALDIRYFIVGAGRKLEERTNTFRIRSIVPLAGPYADRDLMPDFPGMTDAESCRDWDTGFAIDRDKLRPKDQRYWDEHKGTPKAFVTPAAGRAMWANRFGDYTAVRFPVANPGSNELAEIETGLIRTVNPESLGFAFLPVREQALVASSSGQDFGGLFIGFSFFLIIAALALVSMLFQFSIEQRSTEVGTLLAVGFRPGQVRRLLLGEGIGLAMIGSGLGLVGGVYYARAMLHGLATLWRDAVGTSDLVFQAGAGALAGGFAGSVFVAGVSIWLALRKQVNQPARELLAGSLEDRPPPPGRRGWAFPVALASLMAAFGMTAWAFSAGDTAAAGLFFGAGALLLIAALLFLAVLLSRWERAGGAAAPSLSGLGVRNIARRRRRSLATATMLACGSFLVLSIGVFRLDENQNATRRDSGTGGFALLGETTLPVVPDLNAAAGREFFGLDANDLADVSFVPMRVREGDDASCLNLNRAQRPRLLGVNPQLLAERGAFSFAAVMKGLPADTPWKLLANGADGEIPAIADNASILWALGKKVGDVLEYPDLDERGNKVRFRLVAGLANSVLQGSLLIDEAEFARRFPSVSGYQMFLIDAPLDNSSNLTATLSRALRDNGLELIPATRRLAQFNAVQNTYLGTFQILGGLGLLLGSAGLGVVVLRNVLERRGELAVLLAMGFRRGALNFLVTSEHAALLLLGLASGVAAAAVAVLPALGTPAGELPLAQLAATLAGVLAFGLAWTWLAAWWSLRGKIVDGLRNN